MTTLKPREPYTDAELAALYPPRLQLQLVQVLMRHGERTPVSPRFTNTGLPSFWPYCAAMTHMKSAVLNRDSSQFTTMEWKRRLESFGPNDVPVIAKGPRGELDRICDPGMLTDRGRETTFDLGRRLRRLYVDQLGFLPASIPNADFMYLRATPIPRALDSMQEAFEGMYPKSNRAAQFPPPTIITRAPADETLFPNDMNCRRLAILARAFAKRTAERWNDTPEMGYLNKRLGRWMPEDSPRVAVDGHPRLSGIMDTINATYAHGPETRLPSEFYDAKVRRIIDNIGVEEWYAGYKESREYRMLGIGGLLGDVVARMVGSVEKTTADGKYETMRKSQDDNPIRFGLSGCHDTTLAGALSSLGAFEGESWPPFTSHIAIELFRDAQSQRTSASGAEPAVGATSPPPPPPSQTTGKSWFSALFAGGQAGSPPAGIGRKRSEELSEGEKHKLQGYYVRVRYNDKPMPIPGCKSPGKHLEGDESFCTLEAFKAIVDKFTPEDWRQQCRANASAPAFPSKPEPAGY